MTRIVLIFLLLFGVVRAAPQVDTVVAGLSFPWSLAFLPDGSMLVTERNGQLRRIHDRELLAEPIDGVPAVYFAGQGGLLDVVVDPDFVATQRLFLSFSTGDAKANATRVVSARLIGNALTDVQTLFTASPLKNTPHHFGGRMAFLPDNTLLLTLGDGFNFREDAQRLDNHFGKIVRINRDGSVPADNPFVNREGALATIYSYGHRNAQAVLFDRAANRVLMHEHGPRGGDELNRVEPGLNYGWPAITYGVDYNYAQVSPYTELPGMEQPLLHWTPSIAPAGMTLYDGDLLEEWRSNLFVAALAERSIRRLVLRGDEVVEQELLFTDLGERFRDVRTGPDGALYLLTDGEQGRLLRVTP